MISEAMTYPAKRGMAWRLRYAWRHNKSGVIFMFGQINIYEQIIRYGIGALLIVLSVITLQIPMWSAFVATYFIFTALVQRDPLYALLTAIRQRLMKDMKGIVPVGRAYTSS
jgi:hypothetical protein